MTNPHQTRSLFNRHQALAKLKQVEELLEETKLLEANPDAARIRGAKNILKDVIRLLSPDSEKLVTLVPEHLRYIAAVDKFQIDDGPRVRTMIRAVKLIQSNCGVSLREAKEVVEFIIHSAVFERYRKAAWEWTTDMYPHVAINNGPETNVLLEAGRDWETDLNNGEVMPEEGSPFGVGELGI